MRFLSSLLAALCFFSCSPPSKPVTTAPVTTVEEPRALDYEAVVADCEKLFLDALAQAETGDTDLARETLNQALQNLLECRPIVDNWDRHYIEDFIDRIHFVEVHYLLPDESYGFQYTDPGVMDQLLNETNLDFTDIDPSTVYAGDSIQFDMPVVRNPPVERFIKTFSEDLTHIIGPGLEKSTAYLPMIREIFAEYELPLDLGYLPLIESGFRTHAHSRADAVGLWQFIEGTARLYDLKVDWWIDERRDPEKATRAAARFLKDLYEEFGDWNLALSAYNAGPGRVRRALRRTGGKRDFWLMASRRYLPRETRGYVPAFMAGLHIAKNPRAHGFTDLEYQQAVDYEHVDIHYGLELKVLEEELSLEPGTLQQLNPMLARASTPPERKTTIRVPLGYAEKTAQILPQIPLEKRIAWDRYTVKRGDTLSKIASRSGTSVKSIMTANKINDPRRLRIGQILIIPTGGSMPSFSQQAQSTSRPRTKTVRHRIKRGDTLYLIAKRYGTSISKIMSDNPGLDPRGLIPGRTILIKSADVRGAEAPQTSFFQVTVRRGDSLSAIAGRYGVSLRQILVLNNLNRNSTIYPGQSLKVPRERRGSGEVVTYRVRKGDTLWDVAKKYGTTVDQIMTWNRLSNSALRVGQTLVIYQ